MFRINLNSNIARSFIHTLINKSNRMKRSILIFAALNMLLLSVTLAQKIDTTKVYNLNEIMVVTNHMPIGSVDRMPAMEGNIIYAGKKNEVIQLQTINADLSTNNARQVFAKVPGLSIWENDGSGIQIGVAARGLSPNRSWEFNVRQNGYDISSEAFGYPEAYYSPPMEALQKIEVIRGSASLQFGPQFGGLLNFKMKKADPNKKLAVETQQTAGSYGLYNSYNSVGGTNKKLSYFGFLHHRNAEGWRENSRYNIYTGYFSVGYQLTNKIKIEGEYTKMDYTSQQPGGLTDKEFSANNRQSFRERNWFGAPFNIASINLQYELSDKFSIQIKTFGTFAERNSVGFTKSINTADTINATTLQYNARQVDTDKYTNVGSEIRTSLKYTFLGQENILTNGIRLYRGHTKRNQLGTGTTGNDFDLSLTNPQFGRSLEFWTNNYAVFAENIFQIGKNFKVIPGIRFEYIKNRNEGYINTTPAGSVVPNEYDRQILLYGLGTEYQISKSTNIYGNYSLAYRPVTFSELTPSATTEIIDPDLKDAGGFNADLGYRGGIKNLLNFDVSLFYLLYDNRIGIQPKGGATFKTNIGTSESKGFESYIEIDVLRLFSDQSKYGNFNIFASNSFIEAKYIKWNNPVIENDPVKSIKNKRVENAPQFIHRFGASYMLKGFSSTLQFSSVGEVYTDAINSELPNESGTIGKLPGYHLLDVSLCYRFMRHYNVKMGVNNITNEKYATRRSGGYPGPGILPGNGRTIFVSVGASF